MYACGGGRGTLRQRRRTYPNMDVLPHRTTLSDARCDEYHVMRGPSGGQALWTTLACRIHVRRTTTCLIR